MNISPIDLNEMEYGEVIFVEHQLAEFIEKEQPE